MEGTNSGTRLFPSPSIRHARIDGLVMVMNLETETYQVLDEAATSIWGAYLDANGERPRMREILRPQYGDAESVLDEHISGFIDSCRSLGLLVDHRSDAPAPPPRRARAGRWPSVLAWRAMASTAFRLRRHGFAETYRELGRSRWNERAAGAGVARETALAAFVRAENLFWFQRAPRDCLPRSLSLYAFLSQLGFPAVHRIGGRRFPGLAMHAWVESAGEVVLDDAEKIAEYEVLASLPDD
jgi:hypothetical protein